MIAENKAGLTQQTPLVQAWQGIGLLERQTKFLLEYLLNGRNATRAALAAGYGPNGAPQQGSALLKNPKVQRALALTSGADAETVRALVARLMEVALEADIADFTPFLTGECNMEELRDRGIETRFVKAAKARRQERHTKAGLVVEEIREVTLHDPLTAIGMLRDLVQPIEELQEAEEMAPGLVELLYARFDESLQRPLVPGARVGRLPPPPRRTTDGSAQEQKR